MQYMLLIYDDPTTDTPDAYQRHSAVAEEMRQVGVHVAADPLQGVETAKTVRLDGDATIVTDGPFAETREHLGGFYLRRLARPRQRRMATSRQRLQASQE